MGRVVVGEGVAIGGQNCCTQKSLSLAAFTQTIFIEFHLPVT